MKIKYLRNCVVNHCPNRIPFIKIQFEYNFLRNTHLLYRVRSTCESHPPFQILSGSQCRVLGSLGGLSRGPLFKGPLASDSDWMTPKFWVRQSRETKLREEGGPRIPEGSQECPGQAFLIPIVQEVLPRDVLPVWTP